MSGILMYPPHMTSKATRWFEAQSGGSTDSMGVNISPAGTEEGHVEDEEDQECEAEAPSKNHKTKKIRVPPNHQF